ncbi:hypothetical protein QVD17_36891 [Tagetes erecta]|uniref:Reverse transcriptase zinc-binding domain-containing protein n=1 Tax=Tagetes erecta TaxID=13708 RepID=A0AAD8NC92_TARER|nr:hypothetical protein QVD17_36891 [Tagetes erecta]
MDHIVSKAALSRRNIIPDVICQLCSHNEENANHILKYFNSSTSLWYAITSWCKLPSITTTNILELLDLPDSWPFQPRKRKLIRAVFLITLWSIWKARNDKSLNDNQKSVRDLWER